MIIETLALLLSSLSLSSNAPISSTISDEFYYDQTGAAVGWDSGVLDLQDFDSSGMLSVVGTFTEGNVTTENYFLNCWLTYSEGNYYLNASYNIKNCNVVTQLGYMVDGGAYTFTPYNWGLLVIDRDVYFSDKVLLGNYHDIHDINIIFMLTIVDPVIYNNYVLAYGNDVTDNSYNTGYDNGFNQGYSEGHATGFQEGYDNGNQYGYASGYDSGLQVGYTNGYTHALETHDFDFTNLFYAIGDTPILYLRRLFGFELFGMNVMTIFMSLFTFLIVIHVIKKVL